MEAFGIWATRGLGLQTMGQCSSRELCRDNECWTYVGWGLSTKGWRAGLMKCVKASQSL